MKTFLVVFLGILAAAQATAPSDEERLSKLDPLVGRELFACYDAEIYSYHLPELPKKGNRHTKVVFERKTVGYPTLGPLKISNVFVTGGIEEVFTLAIAVSYLKDKTAVALFHLSRSGPLLDGDELLAKLLEEHKWMIFSRIPAEFSSDAIEHIQFNGVAEGMTTSEVRCSIGYPEKQNDWGRGGSQWVYHNGQMFVYFDSSSRVTDIQNIDR